MLGLDGSMNVSSHEDQAHLLSNMVKNTLLLPVHTAASYRPCRADKHDAFLLKRPAFACLQLVKYYRHNCYFTGIHSKHLCSYISVLRRM